MNVSAAKADSGKGSKSTGKDAGHDIRNRIGPRNETEPVMDLIRGLNWGGEGLSMDHLAGELTSMPLARRQSAVRSLQRTRGNIFVQRLAIQAKLKVGPAGDRYEQEADHVADQVMRMTETPNPIQRQEDEEEIQTKTLASSVTPLVQRLTSFARQLVQRQMDEEEIQTEPLLQRQVEEEEEKIQTKGDGRELGSGLESKVQAARHVGQPLPKDVRAFFEPRFGQDFGNVRVHTDSTAAHASQELRALAFTRGQDIFFAQNRYQPETSKGKRLMAHELTHVVQQNPGVSAKTHHPRSGGLSFPVPVVSQAPEPGLLQHYIPAEQLQDFGTAESNAFMRRVYELQRQTASGQRAFVGDLPENQLAEIEGGVQARRDAAAACRMLLSAAREGLREDQSRRDRLARQVRRIGVASGYRSARSQFQSWRTSFPRYYRQTQEERERQEGGEHGSAAARLLARYISGRLAAPGYSLHNNGVAIDFNTTQGRQNLGPNTSQIAQWNRSWFFNWLTANAANFGFAQNPNINEPWHWELESNVESIEFSEQEGESVQGHRF